MARDRGFRFRILGWLLNNFLSDEMENIMQNIFHALSALLLLVTPYAILASGVVIIGLVLDIPGHVRKARESFRRAHKTVTKVQQHDWESIYRD